METRPSVPKPGQTQLGPLGMHRGSRVQASDGPAGQVDQILVDPTDGRATHFVAAGSAIERSTGHDSYIANLLHQGQCRPPQA